MFKAYPRAWVDLHLGEVFYALARLLHPASAASRKGVPIFERAFADFIGAKDAVAFTNCRSALFYSLKALDLEPGSEVILPAFTFWVDPAVVVLAGHKPVFVDVEQDSLNMDPNRIEAAITPKTRVIMPAHLNGLALEMDPIMAIAKRHKLRIIEDCARSCGSRYKGKRVGSFDIGAFSFGYGKSFYGFGGGMAVSDDAALIARIRSLQQESFREISTNDLYTAVIKGCLLKFLNTPILHGMTLFQAVKRYELHGDTRFDSWFKIRKPPLDSIPDLFKRHMFDIQAKLGFRQLRTIDASNVLRKKHLERFNQILEGIPGLQLPIASGEREHVCVHYVIWTEKKRALQEYLLHHGIDAQDESSQDVTQMARFKPFAMGNYPNAAKLDGRLCYLPAFPCLNEHDIDYIGNTTKKFFNA
ncbi:MAG: Arnb transferase [Magnetococcales bacterium]|nr:Arnb transferase [Magnetococcales bacterium]HIJ85657.1 aminotransferase class I/II-fold pyridoxal phosphate-dependent enzyme [Magnetococcales bacterium]